MNELQHHGIKGMKWGKRRFQNTDGSLTLAGKKRYMDYSEPASNRSRPRSDRASQSPISFRSTKRRNTPTLKKMAKSKYVKTGAKVAAAALLVVGAGKVSQGFNAAMTERALRNLRAYSSL